MDNKLVIAETPTEKIVRSKKYNYQFNKETGFFARWGKTKKDDPQMAPTPEILDIEVTTKCTGITTPDGKNHLCKFCYKSNTPDGNNMLFETFKKILDNFKITSKARVITLENNKKIILNRNQQVLLKSGEIKKVKHLTIEDDMDKII